MVHGTLLAVAMDHHLAGLNTSFGIQLGTMDIYFAIFKLNVNEDLVAHPAIFISTHLLL
jgi:hypothetical protein